MAALNDIEAAFVLFTSDTFRHIFQHFHITSPLQCVEVNTICPKQCGNSISKIGVPFISINGGFSEICIFIIDAESHVLDIAVLALHEVFTGIIAVFKSISERILIGAGYFKVSRNIGSNRYQF